MGAVREVERHRRQLESTFGRVRALKDLPNHEELEADYARYLCVLIFGFVERSVAELIVTYADGKAPRPLRSYVQNSLAKLTNVDKRRLCTVIGSLDAAWGTAIDTFVDDERKASLNSIVG